ncbi:MAG TPA: hypothetical protein VMT18_00840, partial [Planctomycetota bacterium]|nr:hypothetical protein [Planctomycetota bacterium]
MPSPRLMRPAALAAGLLFFALVARADVVVLKDGRRIEGEVAREDARVVILRTGLGELTFRRSEVVEILRKKTLRAEYAEREARARTAADFCALGEWAREVKLASLARKAWKRAVELDGDHALARERLGFVRHEGEWLTQDERDARLRAADDAAKRAAGLVEHAGRWITPEDKARSEQGLVEHDGRWVTPEEHQRLLGNELFAGRWMPRAEATARLHAAEAARTARLPLGDALGAQVLVSGTIERNWLAGLAADLDRARVWFDARFGAPPGLELYGGALAEVYVWGADARPYELTVPLFAGWSPTTSPEWAAAVTRAYGLYWFDPWPLSSARQAHRPQQDLAGHCAHQFGHLMLGRLGNDGRLLAPWYDEALAALVEFEVYGRNAVFCQERGTGSGGGTAAAGGRVRFDYDPAAVRGGAWRATLAAALEAGAIAGFDTFARKDFSDLELLDVAAGMGVLTWLGERRTGDGAPALGAFHAVLRTRPPALPLRVHASSTERNDVHDAAF